MVAHKNTLIERLKEIYKDGIPEVMNDGMGTPSYPTGKTVPWDEVMKDVTLVKEKEDHPLNKIDYFLP